MTICLKCKLREYHLSLAGDRIQFKKVKETVKSKYGVEWNSQIESVKEARKETCLEKYGVDNSWKSEEVRAKTKATLLERYGVDNAAFALVKGFKYFYEDEAFDSSWEAAFWIWHKDHDKSIERNHEFFVFENGKKFYPDFKTEDGLVEIKSKFWQEKANQNWELKKKVCSENNILIIDDDSIGQYIQYVKDTYPRRFLKSLRRKIDEN
jgi:hypothetical protein